MQAVYEDAQAVVPFVPLKNGLDPTVIQRHLRASSQSVRKWLYQESQQYFGASGKEILVCCSGSLARDCYIPGRDLDLLFVVGRHGADRHRNIEKMLYKLWDRKFKLGYAIRTPDETVKLLKNCLKTYTASLDLKMIYGNAAFAKSVFRHIWKEGIQPNRDRYLRMQIKDDSERHKRHGSNVYLLEPHVLEGKGWIRDFQSATWMEMAMASSLKGRAWDRFRSRAERRYWQALYLKYLLSFFGEERRGILTFDLQRIAASPKPFLQEKNRDYSKADFERVVGFMKEACRISREIEIYYDLVARATEKGGRARPTREKRLGTGKKQGRALSQLGRIDEIWSSSSAVRGVGWDARLFRFSGRSARLDLRRREAEAFLKILKEEKRVGAFFACLLRHGLMGTLIREFRGIECLVQFDLSHSHTVDYHTIQALCVVDELFLGKKKAGRGGLEECLAASKRWRWLLYVALLFHDLGKALTHQGRGRHHLVSAGIARHYLSRWLSWGLITKEDYEDGRFLIEQHLLMSELSQKRNIDDGFLIEHFANHVKNVKRLNLLTVITVADWMGTGAELWNSWRRQLLLGFHRNVEKKLSRVPERDVAVTVRQFENGLKNRLLEKFPSEEADICRYVEGMPEHYYQGHFDLDRALLGYELIRDVRQTEMAAVSLIRESGRSYDTVIVGTHDGPGVFARIAGTMSYFGLSILSAVVVTRKDGLVIDCFDVRKNDDADWDRWPEVIGAIRRWCCPRGGTFSPEDGFDETVKRRLLERRQRSRGGVSPVRSEINAYDDFDETMTIVDVTATDRGGLLFDVSMTLAEEGCSIHFARINTIRDVAYDTFYISNVKTGTRLDRKKLKRVKGRLREIVEFFPAK